MTRQVLWQAEDVVLAVRGQCLHEQTWQARGVSIDSRSLAVGDLFIALPGSTHDGHDHVAPAFAAGASAAIVSRQPAQVPPDAPLIFVEDTRAALQALGRVGRERARGKIIAVIGAMGDSSTKEMLRLSLSAVGKTYANSNSSNNCAALFLACLPADAEYSIFGINDPQAAELTALVRPAIAVMTTTEESAEADFFQGINENCITILNRENSLFSRLVSAAKTKGIKKILSFGTEGKADARLIDSVIFPQETSIRAMIKGSKIGYTVGAIGLPLVQNSLGALLAAVVACGKAEECAAALMYYKAPKESVLMQAGILAETLFDNVAVPAPSETLGKKAG